jgi:beta-N-acetylhexosaminidase
MKRILLLIFSLYAIGASGQQFFQITPASQNWVDKIFHSLTRKQKIAQLMVMRLSERRGKEIVFLEDEVTKYIKKYNIGSVCLFQGTSLQQAEVLNRLQAKAKTPLMVCVDGETGLGMRFSDVVPLPDQLTIGAISDTELAYKIGKAIGQQCKRAGIQVNYAPVVDINNNPNNPVINYRSLGEDKYKVSLLGTRIMKGMQDEGVMACAKHFPGHGDVSVDSHLDLPVITKSMQELDSLELFPFKQMIKDGVGSVMIAHLYIPAIDTTKNQATSLSRKNVTGLLKETLGFKGLTFTDALEMKGVTKFYPAGQASVQSLIAGNDMLCLPGDLKGSIKKTRKAIRNHKLSWKDIDEKVHKVLLAKYNLGLDALKPIAYNALTEDLNKDVIRLKKEVYKNAITLLRLDNPAMLPLAASKKIAYVGIGISGPNRFASQLQEYYKADCFYIDSSTDSIHVLNLLNDLQNYDAVIIGIHQYRKFPANNFGISKASVNIAIKIQQMKNSISFVFGNPYAVKNFTAARNIIACYEDDSLMHDVAFNLLKGTETAKGKLPVTVDEAFHFGSGITPKN